MTDPDQPGPVHSPRPASGAHKHALRVLLRSVPILPLPEIYDLLNEVSRSRTDLDTKVRAATESLTTAASLVEELQSALDDRVAKVTELRAEIERYTHLAEIEEERARAVVQQLDISVRRGRGRERVVAFALNVVAGLIVFALGVLLGPHLTQALRITP